MEKYPWMRINNNKQTNKAKTNEMEESKNREKSMKPNAVCLKNQNFL